MANIWAHGNAYEHFMGRWSRLVAPRFVSWLHAPAGLRWIDAGLRQRRAHLGRSSPRLPRLGAGRRPERGASSRRRAALVDDDRVTLRGDGRRGPPGRSRPTSSSPGWCSTSPATRCGRVTTMARAAPGGTVWRRTSGTTAAGWRCCGCSGTWPARSTPRPSTGTSPTGSTCASPVRCRRCGRARGSPRCAAGGLEITMEFRDFDDLWQPFLGGTGTAPAYVATLDDGRRERLRDGLRADGARRRRRPDPAARPGRGRVRTGRLSYARCSAPCRCTASSTAASRAAAVSFSVSVRSGARKRSAKASDLRPSPTCWPV